MPGIKVVMQPQRLSESDDSSASTSLANFQILGNILNHRVDKKIDSQPLTSHYRAGHREVKNPAWIEQKRQVDTLEQEVDTTKLAATNAAASKAKKQAADLAAKLEKITKD